MDEKYLYDGEGNFIGSVSDSSPCSSSYIGWVWDAGQEEFKHRYAAELASASGRVDELNLKLDEASHRGDRLQVELLSNDLRWAKKRLKTVKGYPRRRAREKASRAFAVALIVGLILWVCSCGR